MGKNIFTALSYIQVYLIHKNVIMSYHITSKMFQLWLGLYTGALIRHSRTLIAFCQCIGLIFLFMFEENTLPFFSSNICLHISLRKHIDRLYLFFFLRSSERFCQFWFVSCTETYVSHSKLLDSTHKEIQIKSFAQGSIKLYCFMHLALHNKLTCLSGRCHLVRRCGMDIVLEGSTGDVVHEGRTVPIPISSKCWAFIF